MIVEIHILSGSRQGERIELNHPEFRVGSEPGSAVYFDPVKDPHATSRLVEFRFSEDDGWTMWKLGSGELLLNHEPVLEAVHVRSGDVVRLSELGPDFAFSVLASRKSALAAAEEPYSYVPQSSPISVAETSAERTSVSTAGVGRPIPVTPCPAVPVAGATASGAGSPLMPVPESRGWTAPILVAAGIMLGLVALIFGAGFMTERRDDATDVGNATEPAEPMPAPLAASHAEHRPAEQAPPPEPLRPSAPPEPSEVTPAYDARLPWHAVLDRVREALFLIVVEDPTGQAAWPVANACAIRNDTLLTTGTAASAVVSLREMKLENVDLGDRKWRVWAQCPAGSRRTITAIHVHQGYEQLPNEAEEAPVDPRMYFDLGLLTVEEPLPAALTIASRPERGLPVAAMSIPYRSEQMSPFQSYAPRLTEGRVTMFTHLDPQRPESPALLRVTARIPSPDLEAMGPYQIGCPVVDHSGRLVGLYSSPGLTPEMQQGDMHYVVEAGLAALWLDGKGVGSWVEPVPPVSPALQ